MKGLGVAGLIVGPIIAFFSVMMDTSVATSTPSALGYGITTSSDVLNIGLLQNQLMVFLTGSVIFLTGSILFAAGAIEERLSSPSIGAAGADAAASVHANEAPVVQPRPRDPRSAEEIAADDARGDRIVYWIAGALGAILIIVYALSSLGGSNRSASSAAAIEANAAMMAENMEAVADNLEELANAR